MVRRSVAVVVLLSLFPAGLRADDAAPQVELSEGLAPFVSLLTGQSSIYDLRGDFQIRIDGRPQPIELRLQRNGDEAFSLSLTHAEYAVSLSRDADTTVLSLPLHRVAYVGTGDVPEEFSLAPHGSFGRLISSASRLAVGRNLLSLLQPDQPGLLLDAIAGIGNNPLKLQRSPMTNAWQLTDASPLRFERAGQCTVTTNSGSAAFSLSVPDSGSFDVRSEIGADFRVVELSRTELETTLCRGVHRATEILAPAPLLTHPVQKNRQTENGELRWIDGHRVAILHGTPEQIGNAHGQLLKDEARRCIESVLYSFGTVHVIRTGRWFRDDLASAYARLAPHIPERHKTETRSMAEALQISHETAEALNVFPELFHCSGFAVFGSATKDGRLYHGRVLDYMTTIGLQDAATTFVVAAEGQIPFVNVGYGGFIGSVSGMNAKAISLGEMGGRGEGQWDGVPMATLMRRALEECSTLDEVMHLWATSPRTCEYYYVFADGRTNQAVGVAALPESIEFIRPGEGHERLGPGISDSVVLSAGSRLETLRKRVTDKHGQIDAEIGQWLMSRPVAMQSNLHNVLFIPEEGTLYVANASHSGPAAEQPYVRLNLHELLTSVRIPKANAAERSQDR
ncbi:MAG: C45 family peptidase [Planctomycetaceae bacterium]